MTHSPWTLWRYILFEFWRLALLTGSVLVTVLAFTAAVKFLADGRLGPLDTLRFMVYAVPPMLQYALPFAGGFAATLAYHRMAADNELVACHAGGISHRRILVPALASGLVLAAALAILSDRVIPRYLRSMDEMIAQDAARVMVSSINRGEAVRIDRTLIYADSVTVLDPKTSGATNLLYLTGVLMVQLDRRAVDIESEASAPVAYVWFFRDAALSSPEDETDDAELAARLSSGSVNRVVMDLKNFVGRKRGEVVTEQETLRFERLVTNAFRDDPKFFSFAELSHLRDTPERIGQVDGERRLLAACLGERATTDQIKSALAANGRVEFRAPSGGRYVFQASKLIDYDFKSRYWTLDPIASGPDKGRYIVEMTEDGGRPQTLRAARAFLRTDVSADRQSGLVAVTLHLEEVAAVARGGANEATGVRDEKNFAGLVLATDAVMPLLSLGANDLIKAADAHLAANSWDRYVGDARDKLAHRVDDLMREITSKQHERVAVCVACLVMVLTGAVMAMRLGAALPLTVYLWSFFPALGAVITISAGQQLTHELGSIGLILLWGGVAAQGAFTFVQYRELARR